jgi:UDP-glucose 4-epimerase
MTIFATGMSGTIGKYLGKEVHSINCDLGTPSEISRIGSFSENDTLIHLAGIVGAANVEKNLETSRNINVTGSIRLAHEYLEGGGKRFIYISSSHVYSKSSSKLHEDSELGPKSKYAEQKVETESKLRDLFLGTTANLCIVRVFSVLDWDAQPFTLGGAIKRLAETPANSELKNGDDVRDFLSPRRIAETIQSLAGVKGLPEILNLCSGVGLSVAEAATSMLVANGFPVPRTRIHSGTSENPYIVGNNERIKKLLPDLDLRWTPTIAQIS